MIKAGRNYRCIKTHKYAGLDWIEGTKYYADEDYSLINNGCTCFCPKYSKYEHNNLFEDVECDDCVEKQYEQKPSWSEEDEKMLTSILACANYNCSLNIRQINWLKSLKDRVQSKQEWSMYDETILKALIDHFEYKKEFNEAEDYDIVLWLKSLRPQNTWKPSDEQMDALESATENCAYSEYQDCLRELIEQLKKLRKE